MGLELVLLKEEGPLLTGGFFFAFGAWIAVAVSLVTTVLILQMRENRRTRGR